MPITLQTLIEIAAAQKNDGIVITEANGSAKWPDDRIAFVNADIEKMTGYSVAEIIGATPRIFYGPGTSREMLEQISADIDKHAPVRAELLSYRKDGSEYWAEVDIVPVRGRDGQTRTISVQRDMSSGKAAPGEMNFRQERFLSAIRANANAIKNWDNDLAHLEARDCAHLESAVEPGERSGLYAVHGDHFKFRDPAEIVEKPARSILEIGEKRRREKQLQQTQRLESMGLMAISIAHNFNNLLTVILGTTEHLRAFRDGGSPEKLRLIENAARRGAALTEQLLSYSRDGELELTTVDARHLVDSNAPIWRELLLPAIDLDIRHDAGLWCVTTNAEQLDSTILNFVLNARDAMPDGGNLLIRTENVEPNALVLKGQPGLDACRYVMISVADTGSGMAPEVVRSAFDLFFTTKASGKGIGLGLPSVQRFMEQSGGRVIIDSVPQRGTTLRVLLRAADDQGIEDLSEPCGGGPADQAKHILIVDDDPLVRRYVQALLTSFDYAATEVPSGRDALRLLETDRVFDLMFTDVRLPDGMDGWELARRAYELRPDLPILFTSASADHSGRDISVSIDVRGFLRKPYRAKNLADAIRTALMPRT